MTIIFPSPIFGPIHSRRLGVSLGINLLPDDGKVCSFDCIYCECGFNAEHRTKKLLPTREEVRTALEEKLKDMQANGPAPGNHRRYSCASRQVFPKSESKRIE